MKRLIFLIVVILIAFAMVFFDTFVFDNTTDVTLAAEIPRAILGISLWFSLIVVAVIFVDRWKTRKFAKKICDNSDDED